MFVLTIVLGEKAKLEVSYDKTSKKGIITYLVNDKEKVASENFEFTDKWPSCLQGFNSNYGINTNDIGLWVLFVEHNPDIPLVEVWHRN